jgi:hypothetical protein
MNERRRVAGWKLLLAIVLFVAAAGAVIVWGAKSG